MGNLVAEISDLRRRLHNLLRVGRVVSVDYGAARAIVEVGSIQTAPRPWLTQRASNDRSWWAPEAGEQVVLLSPSGDLAQAVILPALYQSAHPPPGDRVDLHRHTYRDGATVEYDSDAHKLRVYLPATGASVQVEAAAEVKIVAPQIILEGAITLDGAVTATSTITAATQVTASGIHLTTHVHGGVTAGGASTGPPS